jgi:hypothetical protein
VKYKVGQLVVNRKLGLGKILGISGNEVVAYFKNEQTNPRTINVAAVPMEISSEQSDPFFDSDAGNVDKLIKPSKPRKTTKRASKAKAEKAEKEEEAVAE